MGCKSTPFLIIPTWVQFSRPEYPIQHLFAIVHTAFQIGFPLKCGLRLIEDEVDFSKAIAKGIWLETCCLVSSELSCSHGTAKTSAIDLWQVMRSEKFLCCIHDFLCFRDTTTATVTTNAPVRKSVVIMMAEKSVPIQLYSIDQRKILEI